jgi:hypothetical protein
MTFQGKPVKSARLFAGFEHEEQTQRLAKYFDLPSDFYKSIDFNAKTVEILRGGKEQSYVNISIRTASIFGHRNIFDFENIETAYHQLLLDLMIQQVASTRLVLNENTPVRRLFVDGGFSKNPIYMNLLAQAFPDLEVFAASVAQATAIGAALAIHSHWNTQLVPSNLIDLKFYS